MTTFNDVAQDDVVALSEKLKFRRNLSVWMMVLIGLSTASIALVKLIEGSAIGGGFVPSLGVGTVAFLIGASWWVYSSIRFNAFGKFRLDATSALDCTSAISVHGQIADLQQRASSHPDLAKILAYILPHLEKRHDELKNKEIRQEREARIAQLCEQADTMVKAALARRHEANPEVQARIYLEASIPQLRHLVSEADRQFELDQDQRLLKWWSKLTRNRRPIKEIEVQIAALELALEKVRSSPSLIAAEADFQKLKRIVDQRINASRGAALGAIPANYRDEFDADRALAIGMLAGAASVPISVAMDMSSAGTVYDTLREVNSNFAGMSDLAIWQESLAMPAESLAGLASLTKGAHFEKFVEESLGGERFSNFNHPDTDITIDGIEYQIKATDSASYIDSVADHIPVIATTEVAQETGAIDGGMSDLQLTDTIDLALGGTVIDFGDTILDGLTTGVGGVGIVAILHGAHSAWSRYRSNGNALEALGVGIETIGTSTARSAVNLSELIFRSARTAVVVPARLVGERIAERGKVSRERVKD